MFYSLIQYASTTIGLPLRDTSRSRAYRLFKLTSLSLTQDRSRTRRLFNCLAAFQTSLSHTQDRSQTPRLQLDTRRSTHSRAHTQKRKRSKASSGGAEHTEVYDASHDSEEVDPLECRTFQSYHTFVLHLLECHTPYFRLRLRALAQARDVVV